MFNRAAYKNIAKKQLAGRWGTPILATIITLAISSALSATVPLVAFCALSVLCMANVYLYITLSHTKEKQPFSKFIQGFSFWLNGILGTLWFILWTILWSCLFLIPGIVKILAYSQMFFIIAESPDMDVRTAMNLSKKITQGHKMDLFIMALSFIGWLILSGFTFGILLLWLIPYMNMAEINAYHSIKQQALDNGIVTAEDFKTTQNTPSESSGTTTGSQYNWDTSNAEDAEPVQTAIQDNSENKENL